VSELPEDIQKSSAWIAGHVLGLRKEQGLKLIALIQDELVNERYRSVAVIAAKDAEISGLREAVLHANRMQRLTMDSRNSAEAMVEAAREFVKRHPALTLIDLAEFEGFLKIPAMMEAAMPFPAPKGSLAKRGEDQ